MRQVGSQLAEREACSLLCRCSPRAPSPSRCFRIFEVSRRLLLCLATAAASSHLHPRSLTLPVAPAPANLTPPRTLRQARPAHRIFILAVHLEGINAIILDAARAVCCCLLPKTRQIHLSPIPLHSPSGSLFLPLANRTGPRITNRCSDETHQPPLRLGAFPRLARPKQHSFARHDETGRGRAAKHRRAPPSTSNNTVPKEGARREDVRSQVTGSGR